MKSDRLIVSHYGDMDSDHYIELVSKSNVREIVTGRPLLKDEIMIKT